MNEPNSELLIAHIDLRDLVFPVLSMANAEGSEAARPMVYGTAFCVGPGLFLTAGHVVENARADGHVALGYEPDDKEHAVGVAHAQKLEVLRNYDLALIAAKVHAIGVLNWQDEPLPLLTDVEAIGFPYSVDWDQERQHWKMAWRGFKGYVITRRALWRLPARPVGYEIDCPFYPGLSGAPLLYAAGPVSELRLVGVVLGEGRIRFAGRRVCFGEAIDVLSVRQVRSELIGGTLGELREHLLKGQAPASRDE